MKSKLRNNTAIWILQVTLVVSLFAFSGFSGSPHTQQKESTKTELPVGSRVEEKRNTSFSAAYLNLSHFVYSKPITFNEAIRCHGLDTKIKLTINRNSILIFRSVKHLLKSNEIIFDSKEDSFSPFTG